MRPRRGALRLGAVKAERWRLVIGFERPEKPGFPFESAALRAGPADSNVGRRTDTLMCADAAEVCGL